MSIIHSASTISNAARTPAAGGENVTLSGTTGTPNLSYTVTSTAATAQWFFNPDGTVDRHVSGTITQFEDGVEWTDGQDSPVGAYWIRATYYSGSSPTGGPTLNVWYQLDQVRVWTWFSTGSTTGTIRIDISNDSSGSPILATGYYQGSAVAI